MPITERTLKKWRQEALQKKAIYEIGANILPVNTDVYLERILRMTQELLDQHLIRKETK